MLASSAPLPCSLLVASLPYSLFVFLVLLVTSMFALGALGVLGCIFSLFILGVLDALGAILPCSFLVLFFLAPFWCS